MSSLFFIKLASQGDSKKFCQTVSGCCVFKQHVFLILGKKFNGNCWRTVVKKLKNNSKTCVIRLKNAMEEIRPIFTE